VALSGDGGDELFLGYDRYRWAGRLWHLNRVLPGVVRRAAVGGVARRPPEEWDRMAARVAGVLRRPPGRVGERLHRLTGLLDADGPLDLYARLMTHWADPPVVGAGAPAAPLADAPLSDPGRRADVADLADALAYLDGISYLPDDILAKVDRASMAVSLETRIPLLDHRVVELAWRIRPADKFRHRRSKWPLRRLLARHLPEAMVDRPKMGFGVPVGAWLRGPLRDWAESLLDERRLRADGYLAPGPVREVWRRHRDGPGGSPHLLWDVLMFQAWAEHAKA
jgi:asparagine synthase (glutamine-hydrolysing)